MLKQCKEGSVCKAIEEKRQKGINLHKQSMNTLLRIKIERNMPVDHDMKDAIADLKLDLNSDNLDKLSGSRWLAWLN